MVGICLIFKKLSNYYLKYLYHFTDKPILYMNSSSSSSLPILSNSKSCVVVAHWGFNLNFLLWPPHAKSWLIGKDPDGGKDWGQEEEGTTEDEMDGWMALLIRWTWVWINSGSWWWTGRPGVLRFMGSQRVRHDWATELNWITNYV